MKMTDEPNGCAVTREARNPPLPPTEQTLGIFQRTAEDTLPYRRMLGLPIPIPSPTVLRGYPDTDRLY